MSSPVDCPHKSTSLGLSSFLLLAFLWIFGVAQAFAVTAIPAPAPILKLGGTDPGYFGEAPAVALDSNGNIYVADRQNRRLQKFDSQGNYLSQFPVAINPIGITILNGTIYLAGENGPGSNLLEYDLSGNLITSLNTGGNVALISVAVDPAANVYILEASHGHVLQYSSSGTLLNNNFGNSSGEAVATDGNYLYLLTCLQPGDTRGPLQKFDFSGNLVSHWTTTLFTCAEGITVDSAEDVRVADTNNHQVMNFTNNGTLIFQTGSRDQGPGQFYYPYGMAVDAQGHTLVADEGNSRVVFLDGSGTFLKAFGKSSLYGMYNNIGVASTPDGHIYVADTLPPFGAATRFSAFDSQGNLTFRRYFFDVLPPNTNWPAPTSLAVGPDGSIYVDFAGHPKNSCANPVIAKFDAQLNRLATISSGCDVGAPTFPTIAADTLGLVYLNEGSDVRVYDSNLSQSNQFAPGGDQGAITVDSQGLIYLTNDKQVTVYNGPGNFLRSFSATGDRLAAGSDRSLFVTDSISATLSIYPPSSTDAELALNLPYFPDGVYVDTSRFYVVGGASGALVGAVNVSVYSNVFISTVTPPTGGDTGSITVTIAGRGFREGATAALRRSGQADINASSATFAFDGTSARAQFNLAGASDGAWDVVVTNPDGSSATLPGAFNVRPGAGPQLWVQVLGHSVVRANSPSEYLIEVGNSGDEDTGLAALKISFAVRSTTTSLRNW
jgi:hypothetical protein